MVSVFHSVKAFIIRRNQQLKNTSGKHSFTNDQLLTHVHFSSFSFFIRAENNPAAWGFKYIDDNHSHFTLILRSDLKVGSLRHHLTIVYMYVALI